MGPQHKHADKTQSSANRGDRYDRHGNQFACVLNVCDVAGYDVRKPERRDRGQQASSSGHAGEHAHCGRWVAVGGQ